MAPLASRLAVVFCVASGNNRNFFDANCPRMRILASLLRKSIVFLFCISSTQQARNCNTNTDLSACNNASRAHKETHATNCVNCSDHRLLGRAHAPRKQSRCVTIARRRTTTRRKEASLGAKRVLRHSATMRFCLCRATLVQNSKTTKQRLFNCFGQLTISLRATNISESETATRSSKSVQQANSAELTRKLIDKTIDKK